VSAGGNWTADTTLNLICTSGGGLCPSAQATSAVADTNFTLLIPGSDLNFSNVVTMSAPDACIANERNGVDCAAGTRPNIGDIVGTLSSTTTLGLTNTPCGPGTLAVSFVFMNATVDNSVGNLVNGSNQWEADAGGVQSPFLHDTYVVGPDNVNGAPDTVGAAQFGSAPPGPVANNGLPTHVDRYPAFLNKIFDPDFAGSDDAFADPFLGADPVQPMARYSGATVVASTSVTLTFLVFAPGDLNAFSAPHALSDIDDTRLGYASVSILQDTTRAAVPGSITDFCTFLSVITNIFGESRSNPCLVAPPASCPNDGVLNAPAVGALTGRVRYQNPSTVSTHFYGGFHQSLRDSDGDGFENDLDTCPYNVNTDASPKTAAVPGPGGGDGPDDDMLDSVCDPGPGTPNANQDGDAGANGTNWLNSGDNCPLNSNPTNEQAELTSDIATSRPRGGPPGDALGDPCDGAETDCAAGEALPLDDDGDGLVNDGCPAIGSAVAEVVCTYSAASEADNDLDGYANDGCPQGGASPESGDQCDDLQNDDSGDDALVNDGCPAQGGPEEGCLNITSDDDDAAPASVGPEDAINDGCPASTVVGNGHFHTTYSLIAKCIGGTDADGDGYCTVVGPPTCVTTAGATLSSIPPLCSAPADPNDTGDGIGTCVSDPDDVGCDIIPETFAQYRAFPVATSGSGAAPPASWEPLQVCFNGIDEDGDGSLDLNDDASTASPNITDDCRPPDQAFTCGGPPVCFGAQDDTDGDGHRDGIEIMVGTDPLGRCGEGFDSSSAVQNTRWPSDLRGEAAFGADKSNVQDLGTYTSPVRRLNTQPGQAAFNRRWDLRPGNNAGAAWITVADMSVVSTQVAPPMFGVRAFNITSVCSSHKTLND
jgi:hypothetical protein